VAFREIDPDKMAFLLAQGTHEGELKKFFTESKTQLLLKGAKVQNLPHGREERIRTICEKLPRKTDDALRTWFQSNVSIAVPASLDEVLMYLEAYFDDSEPLPETEAQKVCRSALAYLFDDEADGGLLQILQRPFGPPKVEKEDCIPSGVEQSSEPESEPDPSEKVASTEAIPVPQSYQLAELIAALISGDEDRVDNALVPFADNTRVLVEALLRARAGDVEAAREQLSLLGPGVAVVTFAPPLTAVHRTTVSFRVCRLSPICHPICQAQADKPPSQVYSRRAYGSLGMISPPRTGASSTSSTSAASCGSRKVDRSCAPRSQPPSMSAGNQAARSPASVSARQTTSGRWSSRRVNRSRA
jgi:hypothetical protein